MHAPQPLLRRRIFSLESGQLLSGCHSYFGSLLCCSWSRDNTLVAAGGQDDLVLVYCVQEKAVVCFGEGHSSWVSAVAFDPHFRRAA